jgi:hypothetical protein
MRYGLPPEMRLLWKFAGSLLKRKDMMRLFYQGIKSPRSFNDTPEDKLEILIGAEKSRKLRDKLCQNKQSDISEEAQMNTHANQKLFFEGEFNRDRLTVSFFGRKLTLTMKSFKYLMKLACARLTDNTGWLHKEQLEPGFNQARYIYNLKRELGLARDRQLLQNNRSGYYRLNLNPEQISFNLDNLGRLQDYEIKSVMTQLETAKACA